MEMSLACHRTQNVGPSGIHRVTGTAMQPGPGDRTLQGASQGGCCPGKRSLSDPIVLCLGPASSAPGLPPYLSLQGSQRSGYSHSPY